MQTRFFTILTIVLITMAAGCRRKDLNDSFEFEGSISQVNVDIDSANIIVEATELTTVQVDMDITYWGHEPDYDVRMDGSILRIDMDCHFGCDGRLLIRVPSSVSADLDTGSGDIRVRGIDGDVTVSVGSGDISMADVAGYLALESESGDIRGSDLISGRCIADTGSGDISLTFDETPERVDLETGSGDVNLRVPTGNYDISISTGSADKHIEQLINDQISSNEIRVETGSGDVSVKGI